MSIVSKKEPLEKQGARKANERWSARCKLRLLRDEPMEAVSREVGVEIDCLERWREKAILGIDDALKDRTGDPLQVELAMAKRPIGDCRWRLND